MTALPARPSLEHLRKQAKKLSREQDLALREAQLLLAREYGFAGWQDLIGEAAKRSGQGLEWAGIQAQRAIHENDVARLKQLIAEYPGLLAWRDDMDRVLLHSTTSYALDNRDPEREKTYNRPECAEVLIDAGALIESSVWENVLNTGAAGMLQFLWNKGVLPRTLPILAALGDLEAVRAHAGSEDFVEAFRMACRFRKTAVAAQLLDRCIERDAELGRRIDRWHSRSAFVDVMTEHSVNGSGGPLWQSFVTRQLTHTLDQQDLPAFRDWLQREPWVLGDSAIALQKELIGMCTWRDGPALLAELLDREPAILRMRPPPRSGAIGAAISYGNAHLVPTLARIWPVPDDLPHAAGLGDFARVKRWFDETGKPALGNLNEHYPANSPKTRSALLWGAPNVQQVLDTALAWACMNRQLEIAAFLLDRGADINTRWATHQPASILHECAMHGNFEAAQFLIDRGIDLTIRDHRYDATAEGWAFHAAGDEKMATFLHEAAQRRKE